jgi:hemerythrin
MKLHAYEASESHFLEHERLLAEVRNLKHSLTNKTAADKHSLIESLRRWLLIHIETSDKALAEYLHARAIPHSLGETP